MIKVTLVIGEKIVRSLSSLTQMSISGLLGMLRLLALVTLVALTGGGVRSSPTQVQSSPTGARRDGQEPRPIYDFLFRGRKHVSLRKK